MAIYRTNEIRIDLNELVSIRSSFLGEKLSEEDVESLGDELKYSLTFDTIYGMVDQAILEYLDKSENHYGEIANDAWLVEIEKNKKRFEMVDLVSPSWTIQVPRLKKK